MLRFELAKPRLKVSWEGIPLRSFRNVWNQSLLALPESSMSLNVSAAHNSAQTAITRMATKSWSLLRLMRGSGTRARGATKFVVVSLFVESSGCFYIPPYLDTWTKKYCAILSHSAFS
jgi:hypothetical protein